MPDMIRERWPAWRGDIRVIIRDARTGRFLRGGRTFRNLIVNAGLNLLRDGLIGAATDTQIHFVAVGTGCGVLATAITSGVAATSLTLAAGIPQALTAGAGLTVMNGTTSETVTVAAAGAAQGATSIPITSWTPANSYAITTTSVAPTPAAGDTALHHEIFRYAPTAVSAPSAGQGVTTFVLAPQNANSVLAELGWFAGVAASATTDSGALVARTLYNHNHTNLESIQIQRTDTL